MFNKFKFSYILGMFLIIHLIRTMTQKVPTIANVDIKAQLYFSWNNFH